MLQNDIVFLGEKSENSSAFLSSISDKLVELGYVKGSFKEAILAREEKFPTAIATEKYNLAIPHTDSEHVIKPGVAFVKFDSPCRFKEMCTDTDIDVNMAFVLLVTEKEEQVSLLSKLMGLFSENELLESLYSEESMAKIVDVLNNKIM